MKSWWQAAAVCWWVMIMLANLNRIGPPSTWPKDYSRDVTEVRTIVVADTVGGIPTEVTCYLVRFDALMRSADVRPSLATLGFHPADPSLLFRVAQQYDDLDGCRLIVAAGNYADDEYPSWWTVIGQVRNGDDVPKNMVIPRLCIGLWKTEWYYLAYRRPHAPPTPV